MYEKRVVAYVDIIGWSAACCSSDDAELRRVADAAKAIHDAAYQYSREKKSQVASDPKAIVHPKTADTQWGAFSDNFVISMPESFGYRLLTPTTDICRRLLRLGFLTRGAITFGDLHHLDNVVYGPAIVEAVALEQTAVYPRLVVSPAARLSLERTADESFLNNFCRQPLVEDHLGRLVVNTFSCGKDIDQEGRTESMFEIARRRWGTDQMMIENEQQIARWSKGGDDHRLEKWLYMRQIMRECLKPLCG